MKDNAEQPLAEATPRRQSGGAGIGMVVVIIVLVVGFFGLVLLGGAAMLLSLTRLEATKSVVTEMAPKRITRAVTISLDGNDKLRYDGTAIETADIVKRLRAETHGNEFVAVKVIVPGETKHSRVVELVELCKSVSHEVEISVAPANPLFKYRLTIDADSVVKHDDKIIAQEDLATELAKIANSRQTTIILAVDSTLPLKDVVSIFKECQKVCERVQISTLSSNTDGEN
jgi:biopolymer transport protein ExbD